MNRRRQKNNLGPRCKRMKRPARLQSAVAWLKQYSGKNVLRSYCKHFGVDWRCAAIELSQLGVELDPAYLKQREIADKQLAIQRRRRRDSRTEDGVIDPWFEYDSPLEAYIAEDHAALHAMECERDSQTGI